MQHYSEADVLSLVLWLITEGGGCPQGEKTELSKE